VRSDLSPDLDLEVEEVERGVYRVLDDGAGHDLVAEPPADLTVAPDGSIWLLRATELEPDRPWRDHVDAVFRLGREGTHRFEPADPSRELFSDLAVGTDGVAWVITGARHDRGDLGSFDGSSWPVPTWPDGSTRVAGIEATEDGAVWVTQPVEDGRGPRVARIAEGEWTVLPVLEDPSRNGDFYGSSKYFAAAADGTAWLANGHFHAGGRVEAAPRLRGLLHFDGTGWEVVDLPVDGTLPMTHLQDHTERWPWRAGPLALGPDGTLWVYLEARTQPRMTCSKPGYLARLRDGEWSLFGPTHGVPTLVCGGRSDAAMAVDGAGRLWIAGPEGGGVRSFDGSGWQSYLSDLRANRVAVTPDGNILATALYGCPDSDCGSDGFSETDWSLGGLYIIDPEAVQ
jgi:hypothetical protein